MDVVAQQAMWPPLHPRQEELSAALDIDRSTLYRHRCKLTAHSIVGVVDVNRGRRGPHRFTPEKRERAAQWLRFGQWSS